MTYIHVPRWFSTGHGKGKERGFQRFEDRKPSWAKLYFDLHRNDSYLALTGHRRAILFGIWIEYGLNVRQDADDRFTIARGLRDDTATLSRRLALRVLRPDLVSLNHAGFIHFLEQETVTSADGLVSLDTQILREEKKPPIPPLAIVESINGSKRPDQLLWDALSTALGRPANWNPTKSERGRMNRAIKELLEVDATPVEVTLRAAKWPLRYPNADLTAQALTNHWSSLGPTASEREEHERNQALIAHLANR